MSGQALYEDVVEFYNFGEHRTGYPADIATSEWIGSSLAGAGFPLVPFMGTKGLYDLDTHQFIDAVRQTGLTQARRVIFGVAAVTSISFENGVFLVSAEADLEVADIETGNIVYTKSGTRTARGRSQEVGVTAVFRGLGEQLGEVLARELP